MFRPASASTSCAGWTASSGAGRRLLRCTIARFPICRRSSCRRDYLVETFGFDPEQSLAEFNACPLFTAIGDSLVTGPTGHNLRDLRLLISESA